MPEPTLLVNLALATTVAFLGGLVARWLGWPTIVGYLLAGVVVGSLIPGLQAEMAVVSVLAEIGVAFLMFAVGAELTLRSLRRFGRVIMLGGSAQILLTMGLGPVLAPLLGLTWRQGLFLGALLALSSTVVVAKILEYRGELQALHGRLAIGILIVQDLAVVPMIVFLPTIVANPEDVLVAMGLIVLKAAAVLGGAYFVGTKAVDFLLTHVAHGRFRELTVLAAVALTLGTALLTAFAGLSFAFGAFLAGLVVAESTYRTHVVAEVVPLRDFFASLFFISLGMLFEPLWILGHLHEVALLLLVTVLGKTVVTTVLLLLFGLGARTSLLTGLSLSQVGEFSFVLATVGVAAGALADETLRLVMGVALVSITLTPFLLRAEPALARLLAWGHVPAFGGPVATPVLEPRELTGYRQHTVICGFGRVGRELGEALDALGMPYIVVDYDPLVVDRLRRRGVPVIHGDAGNPAVLEHTHLEYAHALAVLVPDPFATERTVRYARQVHSTLPIVVRVDRADQVQRFWDMGVTHVVQPEFEAGIEVIREVLLQYNIAGARLQVLVDRRRALFYRHWGRPFAREEAQSTEDGQATAQ